MARKVKQEEVLYNENGERVVYRDRPKKKNPFLMGCLGLLLLGLLFGACSAIMGGGNDEEDIQNTAGTTDKKEAEKKDEPKKAYKIGDTVKVGDMEYKINGVSTNTSVGPAEFPTNAKDTFVIVDIEVKNNGSEAITVDSNLFKLLVDGKTLEADAGASMSANESENSFFLEQLNPDSVTKGYVVFDVSKAMADSPKKVLEVSTGFFGTETEKINLK